MKTKPLFQTTFFTNAAPQNDAIISVFNNLFTNYFFFTVAGNGSQTHRARLT